MATTKLTSKHGKKLKAMAKEYDRDVKELVKDFDGILTEGYMAAFKEDVKKDKALAILRSWQQIAPASSSNVKTDDVLVIVDRVTPSFESKGGTACAFGSGYVKIIDEGTGKPGPTKFAAIKAFNENAKVMDKFEAGKAYHCRMSVKMMEGGYVSLQPVFGTTNPGEGKDQTLSDPESVLTDTFDITPIPTLEIEPSADDYDDLKMVYGNVLEAVVRKGKESKREFGIIRMADGDCDPDFLRGSGGLTMFTDADQIKFAPGSLIYAVGIVKADTVDEDGLKLTMRPVLIHPEVAIPITTSVRAPDEDDVESAQDIIGDDDEDEDEPDDEPVEAEESDEDDAEVVEGQLEEEPDDDPEEGGWA